MKPEFSTRLRALQTSKESRLCVGLDPDPMRLPSHLMQQPMAAAVVAFNTAIISATAPAACAFKLNLAFFEALGPDGWHAMEATLAALPDDVLTIADAKRGDIGNSARFYAKSVFEHLGFDAITVAPYMGRDSVEPFLRYEGKAAIVLARTSNPGAADLQERDCEGEPLYLRTARLVAQWAEDAPGSAALVVGATDTTSMARIREACPTLPFLVPGIGAQGGDPQSVIKVGATNEGMLIVNSSRSIIYASDGEDFAEAAGRKAESLRRVLGEDPA